MVDNKIFSHSKYCCSDPIPFKKKIIKGRVNASVPHFVDCTFKFLHKTMLKQVVKGPPAAEGRHPNVAAPQPTWTIPGAGGTWASPS